MRKFVELGLEKDSEAKHDLKLTLKKLPSIAFEKEEEIGHSYDKIVEEFQVVCNRTMKKSGKKQNLPSSTCILDLIR